MILSIISLESWEIRSGLVKNYQVNCTDWNALRGTSQKNSSSFVAFVQNLKVNAVAFCQPLPLPATIIPKITKECCQVKVMTQWVGPSYYFALTQTRPSHFEKGESDIALTSCSKESSKTMHLPSSQQPQARGHQGTAVAESSVIQVGSICNHTPSTSCINL